LHDSKKSQRRKYTHDCDPGGIKAFCRLQIVRPRTSSFWSPCRYRYNPNPADIVTFCDAETNRSRFANSKAIPNLGGVRPNVYQSDSMMSKAVSSRVRNALINVVLILSSLVVAFVL